MKKLLVLLLTLALVLVFTACSAGTTATETTKAAETTTAKPAHGIINIKYCVTGSEESYVGKYSKYFADLLNKEMSDVLHVDYYPNEQLGSGTEQLENLQADLQQMYSGSFDMASQYAKDLNILTMAYAFNSQEHLDAFLKSDFCKNIWDKMYENVGIKLVTCDMSRLPRCFVSKKPIYSKSDMKGLLWRVPDIDIYYKNIEFMGATPTYVAWSEVPYALMQGTVDACETTCEYVHPTSLHTVAPNISICEYAYAREAIYLNSQTWEKFTDEEKDRFMECSAKAADYYNDMVSKDWETNKAKIIAEGGKIIEKSQMDIDSFKVGLEEYAAKLEAGGVWETKGLFDLVRNLKY
ncbi:MAG: TRAP transporter substrate-binding protein [Clostridiaceae bacterium]|jgi:TRAP-type C4-dicarboxylate transport system substrate-binding protein|nr:TRAP transporter substrate-binding protein [Clostridiaceae bacterium]